MLFVYKNEPNEKERLFVILHEKGWGVTKRAAKVLQVTIDR